MSMPCVPQWRIDFWTAQLAAKNAQLTAAYASVLAALPNSEIGEYEFDSGEGRQRVKRRAPSATMALIEKLEAEIEALYRKLNGYGLSTLKIRRQF